MDGGGEGSRPSFRAAKIWDGNVGARACLLSLRLSPDRRLGEWLAGGEHMFRDPLSNFLARPGRPLRPDDRLYRESVGLVIKDQQ